jgi:hypothetical protein
MITSEIEPIERIRLGLNRIPEQDAQGNEQRFLWQLLAGLGGALLMSSSNADVARVGRILCKGAIESFLDLVNLKADRWTANNP